MQPLEREYRWQKGEAYLKASRDRILFTIDGRPYTTGDFLNEYTRYNPPHHCHHEKGEHQLESPKDDPQLCDFSHNNFEDQKMLVDRMIDKELITEDTYNQMIHVEHQKEIEFVTMASLYPIFHQEEMKSRKQLNFEDIREKVKKDLYTKEHEGIMESWEDNLLKSAGFVIYGRPLQEMLAETKTPENIEGS